MQQVLGRTRVAAAVLAIVLAIMVSNADAARLLKTQQQRAMTRETNSCADRQAPGIICESCELLATCVKLGAGWVNIPVESCDTQNGFYCNANLGACSNTTGPCHPFGFEGNFPCTTQGVFPDPYDCQRYHMCYFVESTAVSASVDCGGDKAFNAATGQCSLTLQHSVCQEPQFHCLNAGDAHPWPNNPNIFYVCKASSNQDVRVLYPTLYRCDDGEVFNGYYCVSPSSPDLTSSTLTTARPPVDPSHPHTTASTSEAPASSTTAPSAGVQCTQLGLLPDPENCRMYYYCSGINGRLHHNECPAGTFYSAALSACTLGTCRNN